MARPNQFELMIKMNRLGPPVSLSSPSPVKFREVHFDQSYSDNQLQKSPSHHLPETDVKSAPLPPTGHIFFKDPFCPPDLVDPDNDSKTDADDMFSPVKLGRNMRASHGQFGSKRRKGVCDLMNERKKLLHQQKEQQAEFSREADSEQLAAALVNDMMQQGFHITPPEHTPHGSFMTSPVPPPAHHHHQQQGYSPADAAEDQMEVDRKVGPEEEEKRLLEAIHREVKRVTGADVPEDLS